MPALGRALVLLTAIALTACAPPPKTARHACAGVPPRVVDMPLHCLESVEAVTGDLDRAAGVHRALAVLAARSPGRPQEVLAGLAAEYARIAEHQRASYVAACRAWSAPCDAVKQLAYQRAIDALRATNDRLRDLHAAVDEMVRSGRRVDRTDDATRRTLEELETTSEAIEAASRERPPLRSLPP